MLEFDQSQWLKPDIEFNTQKKNRSRKRIMKVMENLRNRIDRKLLNKKKDCLECTSKPSHNVAQNIRQQFSRDT